MMASVLARAIGLALGGCGIVVQCLQEWDVVLKDRAVLCDPGGELLFRCLAIMHMLAFYLSCFL